MKQKKVRRTEDGALFRLVSGEEEPIVLLCFECWQGILFLRLVIYCLYSNELLCSARFV